MQLELHGSAGHLDRPSPDGRPAAVPLGEHGPGILGHDAVVAVLLHGLLQRRGAALKELRVVDGPGAILRPTVGPVPLRRTHDRVCTRGAQGSLHGEQIRAARIAHRPHLRALHVGVADPLLPLDIPAAIDQVVGATFHQRLQHQMIHLAVLLQWIQHGLRCGSDSRWHGATRRRDRCRLMPRLHACRGHLRHRPIGHRGSGPHIHAAGDVVGAHAGAVAATCSQKRQCGPDPGKEAPASRRGAARRPPEGPQRTHRAAGALIAPRARSSSGSEEGRRGWKTNPDAASA
mmetsp:Transcript_16103/g.56102  ORF Transcript_16103/g.56102 Transcript_16103/m.56102 type:complete len:289 (+) Transcript_16103:2402-3268(+)